LQSRATSVTALLRGEPLPPAPPPLLVLDELDPERFPPFPPFLPSGLPLPLTSLGWVYMHVPQLLGAHPCVAPGEADLRVSIFVFSSAFAAFTFRCDVRTTLETWDVIFQRFLAVFGVLLASDPVMYQSPEPLIGSGRL
jgi:hypothetical protein